MVLLLLMVAILVLRVVRVRARSMHLLMRHNMRFAYMVRIWHDVARRRCSMMEQKVIVLES